ncbi:hypothetical protein GCM10007937_25900 [Mesorhizobium albiziae]|nr:hypothetical protein GCM10007937_25900 [Mesorhizobium albiziae]
MRQAARKVAYRNSRIINSMLGREYYADVPDRQIFTSLDDLSFEEDNKALQSARSGTHCPVASPSHMPWSTISVDPQPDQRPSAETGMFD